MPYQPYTVYAKVKSTQSIAIKIILLLVVVLGIGAALAIWALTTALA